MSLISTFIQWTAIAVVLGGCALVLAALPSRTSDVLTRDDLRRWMAALGETSIRWLVRVNIAGTLVSFATVVLFFVGNSSIFGIYTLAAILSLVVGALVTKALSGALAKQERVAEILSRNSPSGATIAAVLWTPGTWGRRVTALVKWVSVPNLLGVIWLEFAFLADMGGRLMHLSPTGTVILLTVTSWIVFFVCLRYGVRGIAFLDFVLTPLVFLGVIVLFIGSLVFLPEAPPPSASTTQGFFQPLLPASMVTLFVVHVFCLNPFLMVVTEGHWYRRWAFGEPELRQQWPGIILTAVVSAFLVAIGLLAGYSLPGEPGDALIGRLLITLDEKYALFAASFWIAGTAALFSTADIQILGLLFTSGFRPKDGKVFLQTWLLKQPALAATSLAFALALLYLVIRVVLKLSFDKLVFIIVPAAISLLPLMVMKLRTQTWQAWQFWTVLVGLCIYVSISIKGLRAPAHQLELNLAAILIPVILAGVVWLIPIKFYSSRK